LALYVASNSSMNVRTRGNIIPKTVVGSMSMIEGRSAGWGRGLDPANTVSSEELVAAKAVYRSISE
jgi:hypothetical protein